MIASSHYFSIYSSTTPHINETKNTSYCTKLNAQKKFIDDDEFTLSKIDYIMDYSSVQYISTQFKKYYRYLCFGVQTETTKDRTLS